MLAHFQLLTQAHPSEIARLKKLFTETHPDIRIISFEVHTFVGGQIRCQLSEIPSNVDTGAILAQVMEFLRSQTAGYGLQIWVFPIYQSHPQCLHLDRQRAAEAAA